MNFVIIISDTLRRDHLGCYGNKWISTPHIDKFAEISVVFDNAYIGSFPTVPNRRDLFTGRFTFTYSDWSPLTKEETVLSEILGEKGYLSMFIADTPHTTAPGYNYQRGFSAWIKIRGQEGDPIVTEPKEIELPCSPHKLRNPEKVKQMLRNNLFLRKSEEDYFCAQTMRQACMWLEKNYKEKFFLYVDTFDPHEPWDPPHYYVDMYDMDYDGEEIIYPVYGPSDYLTDREIKHIRAHYAGEVTLVDRWVGRLFEKIEDLGLFENTVIIFTTDHGFYHGEHGLMGKSIITKKYHGFAPLYEEVTHIPLIVYIPGVKHRRISGIVQVPDITSSIVELTGIGEIKMDGISFLPLVKENREIREFAISSPSIIYGSAGGQRVTITTKDGWVLIFGLEIDQRQEYETRVVDGEVRIQKKLDGKIEPELYYLPDDPGQKKNIFSKHRNIAKKLYNLFIEFLKSGNTDEKIIEMWENLSKNFFT